MSPTPKLLLLKGEPKTLQIEAIEKMGSSAWRIKFKTNVKSFVYGNNNVRWLTDPIRIQPDMCRVYRDDHLQCGIDELWRFDDYAGTYWRVKYKSGKSAEYADGQISVVANCLDTKIFNSVLPYMRTLASINPLGAEEGEGGILAKIYERLNFIDDNTAAACYLNPDKCQPKNLWHDDLIYPFGCNASQKKAMACAFEHQVSVIQGPPGTGKTQTILNIIANIILQGKTVMVVSNNNSATQNILEKLERYGVSFIVAPLGNNDNKEHFIANQPPLPEAINGWDIPMQDRMASKSSLQKALDQLDKVYELQNHLAELRQDLHTVQLEWRHFCLANGISENISARTAESSTALRLWLEF